MGAAGLVLALLAVIAPAAAAGVQPDEEPAEQATTIQGRLRAQVEGERQGVEGVEIEVALDSETIDTVTTAEDGSWSVEVPGGGLYEVTLDPDTLPEGIALADEDRATLQVRVTGGQTAGAVFRLTTGEGGGGDGITSEQLAQRIVEGIRFGAFFAVGAVGLSLIFGVTGLVNFAHGELVTFGALAAWYLNVWGSGPQLHLVPAALLALVLCGFLGAANEKGLWRPLRGRGAGLVAMLLISIGLAMAMRYTFLIFFGGSSRPYTDYTVQRTVDFGPVSLPPKDYVLTGIALVLLVVVGLLLQGTRLGTATRAVADNPELAEASGIDVNRVVLIVWVSGAVLAGTFGIMLGTTERVGWDMGFVALLFMFAAVILGGIGTAYGAMVGGLILGLAVQVSTLWIDVQIRFAVGLALMVVVLIFRPQGVMGRRERVG